MRLDIDRERRKAEINANDTGVFGATAFQGRGLVGVAVIFSCFVSAGMVEGAYVPIIGGGRDCANSLATPR